MYYVYIIRCSGNRLYTGITSDIARRMNEHFTQSEKCAKFTRSYKAEALEALWTAADRSSASRLEWRIKHLTKNHKLKLIEAPQTVNELFEEETEYAPADKPEVYAKE